MDVGQTSQPGDRRGYIAQATGVMRAPIVRAPLASELTGWDARLYPGLRIWGIPSESRAHLAQALGEMGVEAEFFLVLVESFPTSRHPSHAQGETFLRQLEAAGLRLAHAADTLEVATQGYLTSLVATHPELRLVGVEEDVWWPTFAGYTMMGEPLEARLRRSGYAYRHVNAVYLASHVEAIAEQLALMLYALTSLPPAGVAPLRALYQGLYELSSALQGDVVPHHLTGVSAQYPGLLASIAQLRMLDAEEDNSLESDLAWAHAQYATAYNNYTRLSAQPAHRAPQQSQQQSHDARAWAAHTAQEWRQVITFLEYLRTGGSISQPRRP